MLNTFLHTPIQFNSILSTLSSSHFDVFPFKFGAFGACFESWRHLLSSRDTYILFSLFFCTLRFFKALPLSCDGRLDDMEVVSTLRATALLKHCIFSDLDDYLCDFLDVISSTDSKDNFSSLDFCTENDSAPKRPRT